MNPREILFIVNIVSMLVSAALAWRVIFSPLDLTHLRRNVLVGVFVLFLLRLFSVTYATVALGPVWQT